MTQTHSKLIVEQLQGGVERASIWTAVKIARHEEFESHLQQCRSDQHELTIEVYTSINQHEQGEIRSQPLRHIACQPGNPRATLHQQGALERTCWL